MPFFSVIIPTYNRSERVSKAVTSVFAQSCADHEVIVVDDGSTDGTGEVLARFRGSLRLIRQQNRGPAAARNTGARNASGEYLAFLDSDDWWFPWTLAEYAAAVESHQRPAWLYSRGVVVVHDGEATAVAPCAPATRRFDTYLEAASLDGHAPFPTGVAVRRDVFQRAGGFTETMRVGEDIDLWFRIATEQGFVLLDAPVTRVRAHHAGNLGEDVVQCFEGYSALIARERGGLYPGGPRARRVRRAMLMDFLMYYAAKCGRRDLASKYYLAVLRFQVEGRFREPAFGGNRNRFIASFPLFLVSPRLHRRLRDAVARFGAWWSATARA
jgi:hypothetical protein